LGLITVVYVFVTKELKRNVGVVEKYGDMDAIRMITECLVRYNNLVEDVRKESCNVAWRVQKTRSQST
jgi:hypothetical protein